MVDGYLEYSGLRVSAFLPPEPDFEPNIFWSVNLFGCLLSSVDGQVGLSAAGGGDLSGGEVVGK